MAIDWGQLTPRLREGDWTCAQHGLVEPRTDGPVPACPSCARATPRVRIHKAGYPVFVEPRPTHCAGPDRHPLAPGRVHLGWRACSCPPAAAAGEKGHRLWVCGACGDEQEWPPHQG